MNEKFHSDKSSSKSFRFDHVEDSGKSERKDRSERHDNKPFRKERSERPNRERADHRGNRGKFAREERSPREGRFSREERPIREGRFSRGERPRREDSIPYEDNETRQSRSSFADKSPRRERKPFIRKVKGPTPTSNSRTGVRLNKYISNAGICSRREADKLIEAGSVSVNGQVVTQMGFMVQPGDVVNYGGETLRSEAKRYFLLNKPKGFITTVDDPQCRETVMMLIDGACPERIYPVGRLDRNTTGLLLFTNDGEMAKKLTHPSTGVYKIYHVELNKPVTREDMRLMLDGIELEDGPIHVDDVQYVEEAHDKRVVGVALHSGKNRIVRRIFESLGYDVHKLDRVVFAGLTKKDLPRGRYRELTEKEVSFLKMI